jgi:uncharacterized protein YdhG (YjbR/CyaY superfamily)
MVEKGSNRTLAGSCLCGAVRYAVADDFKYALNCHCSDCRRATGSAFKPFAGIGREMLVLTQGKEQVLIYGDEKANHDVHCKVCGSLLFSVVNNGAFVHVTLGTLTDHPGIRPSAHIFVGDKAPWFEITDNLPRHDGHVPPASSPRTIDEYLAGLSEAKRAALDRLRKTIKSAAPKAEECISYGIPGFRLDGRLLVSFGAAANHCSFYPGAAPVRIHAAELKAFRTSKGTVRFPVDEPLPASLVRKLVRTRVAEQSTRPPAKAGDRKRLRRSGGSGRK